MEHSTGLAKYLVWFFYNLVRRLLNFMLINSSSECYILVGKAKCDEHSFQWMNEWIYVSLIAWMNEWINASLNEWMNIWMNNFLLNTYVDKRFHCQCFYTDHKWFIICIEFNEFLLIISKICLKYLIKSHFCRLKLSYFLGSGTTKIFLLRETLCGRVADTFL